MISAVDNDIIWGMSRTTSGAYWQQWTTIRCATCICDAVLLSCLVDAGHALQDVLSGEHRPCHRGQRDHLQRHSSARIPARPSKRPGYRGHAGHFPLIFIVFIFSVKHFGGFAIRIVSHKSFINLMYFHGAPQIGVGDTFWLFIFTLNRAKKWFNSIFNSILFHKNSIQKIIQFKIF